MPDSDEYFVVSSVRLEQLSETRISWALEGFLTSIGVCLGCIVAAIASLEGGLPKDHEGFWNWLLLTASIAGAGIFGIIWKNGRKKFNDIMIHIKSGKRYVLSNEELMPAPSGES